MRHTMHDAKQLAQLLGALVLLMAFSAVTPAADKPDPKLVAQGKILFQTKIERCQKKGIMKWHIKCANSPQLGAGDR